MSFTSLLVENVPYILILGGIASASWLLEKSLGRSPVVGKPLRWFVRSVSSFGLFVGVLLMATGVLVWSALAWDSLTQLLLLITGIALFLKPIKDVRWASLIGLAAGCLSVGYVYVFHSLPPTFFGVESKWIYAIIFIVPTLFVYLLFRFVEDLLTFIGTILSFRLTAITLGVLCITQGFLLILGRSLYEIVKML